MNYSSQTLLRPSQASFLLEISARELKRRLRRGELPAVQVQGKTRFLADDLMQGRTETTVPQAAHSEGQPQGRSVAPLPAAKSEQPGKLAIFIGNRKTCTHCGVVARIVRLEKGPDGLPECPARMAYLKCEPCGWSGRQNLLVGQAGSDEKILAEDKLEWRASRRQWEEDQVYQEEERSV